MKKALLSIVIPFHNSEGKCDRLLNSLLNFHDEEVEVICVDDGSTDSTLEIIRNFKEASSLRVEVISQDNRGPGGARNSGIDKSTGEYIWLVDSDDEINLEKALGLLRSVYSKDYDLIDFNISSNGNSTNSMDVEKGEYTNDDGLTLILLKKFGRIFSKVINSRLFRDGKVRYPEFCIYEDNPLQFIIPFHISSLLKSDLVAYIHHVDHESVTREPPGKVSPRYFDRMHTSIMGYKEGVLLAGSNEKYLEIIKEHFVRLYVINTGRITKYPSHLWLDKSKVIKQFREDCKDIGVKASLKGALESKKIGYKMKVLFVFLWMVSFTLPSQKKFFESKRIEAWGKPFDPYLHSASRLK